MMKAKRRLVEFPSSGKQMYIPAISMHALGIKLQRKYPPPQPPLQKVDYGDGREHWERNYAHPDLRLQQKGYDQFILQESQRLAFLRLYKVKLNEQQRQELQAWKSENPDLWDEEDGDTALWLEEVALTDGDDFDALIAAMGGIDEEVVQAHADSFPGDV